MQWTEIFMTFFCHWSQHFIKMSIFCWNSFPNFRKVKLLHYVRQKRQNYIFWWKSCGQDTPTLICAKWLTLAKNGAITVFCKTYFCKERAQNEYHIIFTQLESGSVLATQFLPKPENLRFQYQMFNELTFWKIEN